MSESSSLLEKAKKVKRAHERMLLAKPNVIGVGVGFRIKGGKHTEHIGIVVMVSHKLPARQLQASELIPPEIEGIPIDVQERGEIYVQY